MTIQQKLVTAKEFFEMGDTLDPDKRYELFDGEIVEMPPPNRINSFIAGLILTALNIFIQQNKIKGYAFGADGGFALTDNDVCIPDVSFIFSERMPKMGNMKAIIAPDLAVEVISPSETPRKVNTKTTLYLNTGTQIVWNVYPTEKVVEVWTKGAGEKLEMLAFTIEDTLDGGDVLPEFTLALRDIFAQIEDKVQ
jgi:Uma2 family endonuclease